MPTDAFMPHSDKDLERRVKNFLSRQHFPALRSVQVESDNGVVTIRGRLTSFHERQLCINCCQRVAGVARLNDQIEVIPQNDTGRPWQGNPLRSRRVVALTGW
jgi:osmotically-inducible protein OsmY